jgi:hypothetical protein
MTDHYDQREDLYAANLARGGGNDLRSKDAVSVLLAPLAAHVHTGEHSHFHSVTEAGQHSYGIPGLTRAAPVELDPIAPGDEWPRSTPLKTPLRARVFYDGSLVIDNPARPLVVRPLRPDDMNGHTEEIVGTEVDAEAFIRAAIMLAQAMGERL